MLFLLLPILLNPPLWPVGIAVSTIAIGTGLIIANVNPVLGIIVAIF